MSFFTDLLDAAIEHDTFDGELSFLTLLHHPSLIKNAVNNINVLGDALRVPVSFSRRHTEVLRNAFWVVTNYHAAPDLLTFLRDAQLRAAALACVWDCIPLARLIAHGTLQCLFVWSWAGARCFCLDCATSVSKEPYMYNVCLHDVPRSITRPTGNIPRVRAFTAYWNSTCRYVRACNDDNVERTYFCRVMDVALTYLLRGAPPGAHRCHALALRVLQLKLENYHTTGDSL